MNDGYSSPNKDLEKPIDTAMPHSTQDVRDLADVMRTLANAIDDAIDLINSAYEDTDDGGWDDDAADKFRASLMVGRSNASDLESDVRTFATKLDDYAEALNAADKRLKRARETADAADLLEGSVIHPPETGTYIGEGMAPPDQREPSYKKRDGTEDAYESARAEFDLAAEALANNDGIPQFAKDIISQTYFSSNDFIKGEIADVAQWYHRGNASIQALLEVPAGPLPPYNLLPDLPDNLVLRAVKSYGSTTITVFGVAFDVYTGTPVKKQYLSALEELLVELS